MSNAFGQPAGRVQVTTELTGRTGKSDKALPDDCAVERQTEHIAAARAPPAGPLINKELASEAN